VFRAARAPRLLVVLATVLATSLAVSCGGGGGGSSDDGKDQKVKGFRVLRTDPPNGAIAVPIDSAIEITFSSPVRPFSVDNENVLLALRGSGAEIRGAVTTIDGSTVAVFTPNSPLLLNTKYRIRVLEDVLSSSGTPLGEAYEGTFTTSVTGGGGQPPPPPPTVGTFVVVGNMNLGRSSHTSTLLSDGLVLVTGGFVNSNAVTNSAETYDGTNFTFTYTKANMGFSRAYHTATLLDDGKMLILGGVSGGSLAETNSAELYNPTTRQFESISPGMIDSRAFHTATLLSDGRILILGGTVPTSSGVFSSKKAEIYDPSTKKFLALPEMGVYRAGHTATMLDNGLVLILGGNGTDLTIELFDSNENKFVTSDQTLFRARRGHSATRLSSTGDVVINGGGSRTAGIWVARDSVYKWTSGVPIEDRKDHTAAETASGRILFSGGSRYEASRLLFSQTTEYYDRFSGAFLGTAPLLVHPTTRHRATRLRSGNILITGGSNVDPTLPEHRAAQVYTEQN